MLSQNFYAADGGRAGYAMGGNIDEDDEDCIRSAAGQSRRQPTAFLNMGGGAGGSTSRTNVNGRIYKI